MNDYGINIWGDNNFIIENDVIKINHKSKPSLKEITEKIHSTGINGPVILRFPHLIEKQINSLYESFQNAIVENSYTGSFNAVFPLKVNQYNEVIEKVVKYGKTHNYGLEAGSKAELIIAMALTPIGSPIIVNGFKDKEMFNIGFIAAQMGHDITLIIEGVGELKSLIQIAKSTSLKIPKIGIRIRLHNKGESYWSKSCGINAKFGLTTPELFEAINLMHEYELFDYFTMLHFHIGSQINSIHPLKKALREVGNVYAELKKMGAVKLSKINIGGGLAVEYAQHNKNKSLSYSLQEYSNDIIFMLKEIMDNKQVAHPDIYTESGRFIVASHSIVVAPVLGVFSQDYDENQLQIKQKNPPLIDELIALEKDIDEKNNIEYLHDALDHQESLLNLFDLGYIDLRDRSNAEILVCKIIKKAISLYRNKNELTPELESLQNRLQERYLLNNSFFQSIPDYWGIKQHFPVMPLNKLNEPALRAATLWDITCDSDGEVSFDPDYPLYLHDIDINKEDYYIAFFNVGAYQEALGMKHNLFDKPTECSIEFTEDDYTINIREANNIFNTINSIGYNSSKIMTTLKSNIAFAHYFTGEKTTNIIKSLDRFLYHDNYLKK